MQSPVRKSSPSINVSVYLQPDVLTPFEFFRTYQRCDRLLPEMKLVFAVLTNAIECLQKYSGATTRGCMKQFKEAEDWIFNKDSQGIYSFKYICEVLELDPSYLRKGLTRWIDSRPKGSTTGPRRRIREPLRLQRRLRDTSISL